MTTFHDITTDQLRQIIQLRERIEFLQETLRKLRGDVPKNLKRKMGRPAGKKRTMSAATIEKMRTAQQARWAGIKGKSSAKAAPAKATPAKSSAKPASKKKVMSPEQKAKIAAAMKARWEAKKKGDPAVKTSKV